MTDGAEQQVACEPDTASTPPDHVGQLLYNALQHGSASVTSLSASMEAFPPVLGTIAVEDGPPVAATRDEACSGRAPFSRLWLWSHLAARMTPSMHRMVEFAKQLPAFASLEQDDQLILIKAGFFEAWLVRMASFCTATSLAVDRDVHVTHSQLSSIYEEDFATGLIKFARELRSLCLTELQTELYLCTVLMSDREGLADGPTVAQQNEHINSALRQEIYRNHTDGYAITSTLSTLTTDLRTLGFVHRELLAYYQYNWSLVQVPPLFAEVFDIPKGPEPQPPTSPAV